MARARSLWSGSLSFGLVNVPVSLVSAVRDQAIHFHQIHKKTHERLHVSYVCTKEKTPVDYSEIAHGFDTGDGYVMLTDDELAAAQPEKTRTIDISEFVDVADIDPVFYEQSYFLVPLGDGEGPARAYRLLVEVMEERGLAALGSFVLRTKERLVAIRVRDGLLQATTMNFPDEVRNPKDLDLPTKKHAPSKKELDNAVALVEELSRDFDPKHYKDRHRDRLLKIIERKRKGQTIEAPADPEVPKAVPDLLEALERSLAEVRGS